MPRLEVHGHSLAYEELGHGPPLVLTPGLRNDRSAVRGMGETLSRSFRVIIYDRLNCGASDVGFPAARSEVDLWAADLHALLGALDALPAAVCGFSLGGCASLLMALRHPEAVSALLIGWVLGGPFPRDRVSRLLYTEFREAAERGGMAAVAETSFFAARILENPRNRSLLEQIPRDEFVAVMRAWEARFREPTTVTCVPEDELSAARLSIPILVIGGDDEIHLTSASEELSRRLPGAEYQAPLLSRKEWEAMTTHEAVAGFRAVNVPPIFLEFVRRRMR
jgi:pimeloyl-ACP methyl ester carboxylesterase